MSEYLYYDKIIQIKKEEKEKSIIFYQKYKKEYKY